MSMLVLDALMEAQILAERRASGGDHHDEVWDGVYVMPPLPNNEHQEFVLEFWSIFRAVIDRPELGRVFPGVNVSDRDEGWTHNYRCPDAVVFLRDNPARDCGTHWVGGPDFAVEVVSPYDQSRDKLPFYAKVGVRELLVVDRDPWALELYRLQDGQLLLAGRSAPDQPDPLASRVLPLSFRLVPSAEGRPRIEVTHADGRRRWLV